MDIQNEKTEFSIVNLREIGYSYKESIEIIREYTKDPIKFSSKVQVGLNVNYRWDLTKNFFAVLLDYEYIYNDSDNDRIYELLKFSSITEFVVVELKNIFKDKGNRQFEINQQFESTFVSLAISSGRGMLAAKTAGTFMSNYIFPIVNPTDFILSKKIEKNAEI